MNILFVWTGVTSYMADCWRKLQQMPDVELKLVVERVNSGKDFSVERVLRDLDVELVDKDRVSDFGFCANGWRPDVIFAGGWRSANTRRIVDAFPDVGKVFCLDMPWRRSLKCLLARFALWRFMHEFDRIYVPGAWSAKYARWLGFSSRQIERKLYAVDFEKVRSPGEDARRRKGFLFLGRFASEKRLDLAMKAYARYRALGGTWPFDFYGSGCLPAEVDRTVAVHSFAQPEELPGIYRAHACLVMASAFDPWPLVILESRAAGLDVIASDRCGNGEELGARRVPFGDVEAMAREMLRVENGEKADCVVGLEEYDCRAWVRRTLEIARRTRRVRGWCPAIDSPANGMAVVARFLTQDAQWKDAYIVHGMWLPRGWLACLVHFRSYVRMTHGSLSPLYLECQGKWKKRLVRPIERFFLRHAKKVLATCDAERDWILAYEPKAKVEVVDVKKYFRLEGGKQVKVKGEGEPRTVHLLYLGRRHPLKGVEYLEKSVEQSNDPNHPNHRTISLRLVSDATGEEKERVWDWCDVLVLPTLSENFGLVVAEALERGKRVITTDGAPAWDGDDYGGRLIYLKGYRDGSDETRVRLLAEALKKMI